MPLYDQETMVKLVSELRKNVARLKSLAELPQEDFLNDDFKRFLDSVSKFLGWQNNYYS
jgi:hypothetical protein